MDPNVERDCSNMVAFVTKTDNIMNRRFAEVYDELMRDVGVNSGRTFAKHMIARWTSKRSGHDDFDDFSTVKDVLDDYDKSAYVGVRGFGPTTRKYLGIFMRRLKERMFEMNRLSSEMIREDTELCTIAKIQYIQKTVSREALYSQLAEECVELAHAALKMARIYRDDDSSIDQERTAANIVEEFNDILNVMNVLGYNPSGARSIMDAKINRWYERLTNHGVQNDG